MPARKKALEILIQFETRRARLDELLDDKSFTLNLKPLDRKLLRNLVAGSVRHLILLDWYIDRLYKGRPSRLLRDLRLLLRLGLYEIIFLEHIPHRASVHEYVALSKKKQGISGSKLVNGILRSFLRQKEDLDRALDSLDTVPRLTIRYSFPEWLIKRWLSIWPEEEVEALCRAFNQRPSFDIRINVRRIPRTDFINKLNQLNIDFTTSRFNADVLTILDVQGLISSGILEDGLASIQDESAAIPAELLEIRPSDRVLDMCAAPGGKFTQILEMRNARGLNIAMDSDLDRLKRVRENSHRLGYKQAYYVNADGRHPPFKQTFTKILLDAPCSGLGVITKHPDIKWRRSIREIREFSSLQHALLESAVSCMVPDGRLVYSTCTIDKMENENLIGAFLEKNTGLILQQPGERFREFEKDKMIRTLPHQHKMDGSFAVVLQKSAKK